MEILRTFAVFFFSLLSVLFVIFELDILSPCRMMKVKLGCRNSPSHRRLDATRTGAASLATHSVSSSLKIDLPPAFKGDWTESFTSWSRRFEVAVQAMSSTDTDLSTVMASNLPTRLADAAFLYWDSLPASTQRDYD